MTKYADIDVAVLCLHGINGEDGSISAILEASKIPYINSSIMPSSVAMDKIIFNYFIHFVKASTTKFRLIGLAI